MKKKQTIILPKNQRNTLLQLSGISGFCFSIVLSLSVYFSLTMESSWFDWTVYPLSALGSLGTSGYLFNTGLIVSGVFAVIFSLGYMYVSSNKTASALLFVGSICMVLAGLITGYQSLPHLFFGFSLFFLFIGGVFHLFLSIHNTTIKRTYFEHGSHVYVYASVGLVLLSILPYILFNSIAMTEFLLFVAVACLIIPFSIKMLQSSGMIP